VDRETFSSFEEIKNLVANAIELKIPCGDRPFQLQTDASDKGIGGVLLQEIGNGDYEPVGVCSRKLNYSVTEKELLAIVWSVQYFRSFIEGLPVEVLTDHSPLRFLESKPVLSRRLARWMEILTEFDITIKYRSGKTNTLADLLSRYECSMLITDYYLEEFSNWPVSIYRWRYGEHSPPVKGFDWEGVDEFCLGIRSWNTL
jgi:RNase H-like domain found in reverse transcriptase